MRETIKAAEECVTFLWLRNFQVTLSYTDDVVRKGSSNSIQAFLNFRGFNIRNFQFTAVYNSILFSSPLLLQSNLDLRGFCFLSLFFETSH